jgi:hypothetical protein
MEKKFLSTLDFIGHMGDQMDVKALLERLGPGTTMEGLVRISTATGRGGVSSASPAHPTKATTIRGPTSCQVTIPQNWRLVWKKRFDSDYGWLSLKL